jgi:hypothetical protein
MMWGSPPGWLPGIVSELRSNVESDKVPMLNIDSSPGFKFSVACIATGSSEFEKAAGKTSPRLGGPP